MGEGHWRAAGKSREFWRHRVRYPVEIAADFRETFGVGCEEVSPDEAELLTLALLADPTSRLVGAVNGWQLPLGLWMRAQNLAYLAGLAGEKKIPWPKPAAAPVGLADRERLAQKLASVSLLNNLPE